MIAEGDGQSLGGKVVFPARFFSAWSYHTEMITGGWAGCASACAVEQLVKLNAVDNLSLRI
jgi:hypothetical protein